MSLSEKQQHKQEAKIVQNSINTLYKNIFSKKEKEIEKEKEKKEMEYKHEINQINNQNYTLKNQFCKQFDGFGDCYKVGSLSSIKDNYSSMYEDFLCINAKLIDGKLKDFLFKYCNDNSINNNNSDVDFVYKKIISTRNICSLLPLKHCQSWYMWNMCGSDYVELINRFNENKNERLKMFCICYNACANLLIAGDDSVYGGFDAYVHNHNNDNIDDDLCGLFVSYVLIYTDCSP